MYTENTPLKRRREQGGTHGKETRQDTHKVVTLIPFVGEEEEANREEQTYKHISHARVVVAANGALYTNLKKNKCPYVEYKGKGQPQDTDHFSKR